jgi:hypothetical protein
MTARTDNIVFWIVGAGAGLGDCLECERVREKLPKKLRGCIAASPRVPFGFCEELTSSSWLSFSLPCYSPPNFLKFTPALLAERVFNLMYSDTA